MLQLISSFYVSRAPTGDNDLRDRELETALRNNLRHPQVAGVSVFADDAEAEERARKLAEAEGLTSKLTIAGVDVNPLRFDQLFAYADRFEGRLCMVHNADIHLRSFDPVLLGRMERDPRLALVLTRHDSHRESSPADRYGGAHDAYVFVAPLARNVVHNSRHPVPTSGGENVIIWELQRSYCVMNPWTQVVIVHEHGSELRPGRRPRINTARQGLCRPRTIPEEVLRSGDLVEWHARVSGESPPRFSREVR